MSNTVPDDLRILIASTPKTGNTWLRHLLAAIYDLPSVKLSYPFDPAEAASKGSRWINHEHYPPGDDLIEWAKQPGNVLITTIRHPGDVLISLYHHVRSYRERDNYYQLAAFGDDDGSFGPPVYAIVQTFFPLQLAISVDWMNTGLPLVVDYESLYFDPVSTLVKLTNAIQPVTEDTIERAIERCDIREMRALALGDKAFFRQGGSAHWQQLLPENIIELFRSHAPYPEYFSVLSYSPDNDGGWSKVEAKRPAPKAQFFETLGLSPQATSLFKSIFLSFETAEAEARWNTAERGADLFCEWLQAPADDDTARPADAPVISNLLAQLHAARSDIRNRYPDLYGANRTDVLFWMLIHAQKAYQFSDAFIGPIYQEFVRWGALPAPENAGTAPVVSNLVAHLYQLREDVVAAFPDLFGENREDVLLWMAVNAAREYGLGSSALTPSLDKPLLGQPRQVHRTTHPATRRCSATLRCLFTAAARIFRQPSPTCLAGIAFGRCAGWPSMSRRNTSSTRRMLRRCARA